MFEYKFKEFDFRGFMDFVLSLQDYYGLGQIKFYPDKKEFFDNVQLCHIAPGRNVNNRNGFVWAWRQKQNEVREVTFDQFTQDQSKKINMTINLDKSTIKLNSFDGISPINIEEVLKDNLSMIQKAEKKNKFIILIKKILSFILKYLWEIIVALIIAYLIYFFRLNQ